MPGVSKAFGIFAVGVCLLIIPHASVADIVVIVHPENVIDSMTAKNIQKIFLGKTKHFPGGGKAVPVDQIYKSNIFKAFSKKVINKSGNQLRAYWIQFLFTGKGKPPEQLTDNTTVREQVSSSPESIGYIDDSLADESVKIVYRVK